MSRRRAKVTKASADLHRPANAAVQRARVPAVSLAVALLLMLSFVVPFILWGNPYPEGVVPYWLWGTAVTTGVAVLVSLSPLRKSNHLQRIGSWLFSRPAPVAFAFLVSILATTLGLVFAVYAFSRSATTSDEIAQLWHAKMILRARLFLPPDPNPEFFALENVIDVDRWYSQFPIGGPLVLAIGAAFDAPWIVNPVLLGLGTAGLYHFARRAFGEAEGRLAALLFVVAPMVLIMAGTWMNHVPVLCLTGAALAALVEWERAASSTRRVVFASLVGLSLGAMATIRPVDAIIVSLVVGLFQLWTIRRDLRRVRELFVQGIAGALAVAPLFYANAVTTGHPLRFGYDVMWGAGHRIGFHEDPYGNVHTVGRALEYAITYVSELNMYLMAWPVPALLVAVVGLLAMRPVTRWNLLLVALFGAQVVAYASYGLVGEFLGPRFLYSALPTIIVLIARTPFLLADRFGSRGGWWGGTLVLACTVVAWGVVTLPYGVWGLANQARTARRNMRVDIAGAIRDANVHRALVFLREPFGSRLQRRLWGAGFTRGEAVRLLQATDACSLLAAVRAAEADTTSPRAMKPQAIVRSADPLVMSDRAMILADRVSRVSSPESITPECRAELQDDARLPTAPFGPALPLEPVDAAGRINGDVIYVADLGAHNAALRDRFGDRTWYRLAIEQSSDGSLTARVDQY